jgi:hypothetical protein
LHHDAPRPEFVAALGIIEEARELAERHGRTFVLQAGFSQVLAERVPSIGEAQGAAS